jgi:hypothetical protein
METKTKNKQMKVVSKGYTITCTSWENDGDNYNTKSIVVESKDKAEAIYKLCTILFKSENRSGSKGIGNPQDLDEDVQEKITNFFKKYPILLDEDQHRELIEIEDKEEEQDFYVDICAEWMYELLGGSEDYYCRVAEKTTVTYSEVDIFVEQIF